MISYIYFFLLMLQFYSYYFNDNNLMHVLDSTTQTPDTVERRKLAIVQEVLYGQDKVYEEEVNL